MKSSRRRINVCTIVVSIMASSFVFSGCYYEIRDAQSGKSFYTEQWAAADGYQGPLTFEDHAGAKRRIEHAQVFRIGKRDYLEATTPPPDESAPTEQTAPPK